MLNFRFDRIDFDPDKRLLELTEDCLLEPTDARREAMAWHSLGYHLQLCNRALADRFEGLSFMQLPLALLVAELMLIQTAGATTGTFILLYWLSGVPSFLAPLSIGGFNLALCLMATHFMWPGMVAACEEAQENARIQRDGRWTFLAQLAADIKRWNEDVLKLQTLERSREAKLIRFSSQLMTVFDHALRRRHELMLRLHLAEQLLIMGGPLGECRVELDYHTLLEELTPKSEKATPLLALERSDLPVFTLGRRITNAVTAVWDGVKEAWRQLRGHRS